MKISEIIELTQKEPLNKIAKEYLSIGEKPTREALKNAGCYSVSGKKGWFYDGDPEQLEKSIYEFTNVKSRANGTTKEQKNKTTKKAINEVTKELINKTTKEGEVQRKRASFDINVELLKQLKIRAVMEERNLYDLVEEAFREYLKKEK